MYEIVEEFPTVNQAMNYIESKMNEEEDSLYVTRDMFNGKYEVVKIR